MASRPAGAETECRLCTTASRERLQELTLDGLELACPSTSDKHPFEDRCNLTIQRLCFVRLCEQALCFGRLEATRDASRSQEGSGRLGARQLLRITQKLPIYKPVEVELFFDFINFGYWLSRRAFGYTELLTNTNNAVFYRRLMGAATYNAAGQVRPTYTTEPGNVTIDNIASRWRVQFGATVRF